MRKITVMDTKEESFNLQHKAPSTYLGLKLRDEVLLTTHPVNSKLTDSHEHIAEYAENTK